MSAPLDIRADARLHLAGMLASHRGHLVAAPGWPIGAPAPGADDAARLEALLAVAAITPAEAAEWRTRLDRAGSPPPALDPAVRARASRYLEDLDGEHAHAAVDALVAVGALPSDTGVPVPGGGTLIEKLSIHHGRAQGESALKRVLPGPAERVAGVRVTAVELYERAMVLYWHFTASSGDESSAEIRERIVPFWYEDLEDPDDEGFLAPEDVLSVQDDRGTRYDHASGGTTAANDGRYASGHLFTPAVPAGATELHLLVAEHGRITIPL